MDQLIKDIVSFFGDLAISQHVKAAWLHNPLPQDESSWHTLFDLIHLELTLNPYFNIMSLACKEGRFFEEAELLRQRLSDRVLRSKDKGYRRPKMIPNEQLAHIWSWMRKECSFRDPRVRKEYDNGVLTKGEAFYYEFERKIADEIVLLSKTVFGSQPCRGGLFGFPDSIDVILDCTKQSFEDEEYETVEYGSTVYQDLSNQVNALAKYFFFTDRILMRHRRINASAVTAQKLLSRFGFPAIIPPTLCERVSSTVENHGPAELFRFCLYHEIGHRHWKDFSAEHGLSNSSTHEELLLESVVKELIADLYTIVRCHDNQEETLALESFALHRSWPTVSKGSAIRSQTSSEPKSARETISSDILLHIALSASPKDEINKFFDLLAQSVEEPKKNKFCRSFDLHKVATVLCEPHNCEKY